MIKKNKKHHLAKRLGLFLLILLILLSVLVTIGWFVLRSDHKYVIEKLKEVAHEKWNADFELAGYQLKWIKPFPNINLQIRGARFGVADNPNTLLRVSKASSAFTPWNLLTGDFELQPFEIDSIWIHLYKDSLNQSNSRFSQNMSSSNSSSPTKVDLSDLPLVNINFLDFYHQNDFKKKWQRAYLEKTVLQSGRNEKGETIARLLGDCHFEGLVFNQRDGGFLMDTDGQLDFSVSMEDDGQTFVLENSSLQVDQNTYFVTAKFQRSEVNHLNLQINSNGFGLQEVLPLLSEKINFALQNVSVDKPLNASFTLDDSFIAGQRGVTRVDFSTKDAHIKYEDIDMTGADLIGYFSNDCDGDGIGDPLTNCISVQKLDGELYGLIPSLLQGQIDQLNNPQVSVIGHMDLDLPRLNPMLEENNKITFSDGDGILDFEYKAALKYILENPFDEENIWMRGTGSFENMRLNVHTPDNIIPPLAGHLSFGDHETILEDLTLNWKGSNVLVSGTLNNLPEFLFFQNEPLKSNLRLYFDELDLNKFVNKKKEPKATDQASKKARRAETKKNIQTQSKYNEFIKTVESITSNINGKIELEIDKLIYDTLFFTEVKTNFKLLSPQYADSVDSTVIRIERLTANLMGTSPVAIDIGLYRDSESGTQLLLDVDIPSSVPIANVLLPKGYSITEGSASLRLSTACNLASVFVPNELLSNLRIDGALIFDKVEANIETFPWPVRKLSGAFEFNNKDFVFNDLSFTYRGSPFSLNGQINDYFIFDPKKRNKATVDLRARGQYLNFRTKKGKPTLKKKSKVENNSTNTADDNEQKALTPAQLFRSLDTVFHHAEGKIDLLVDSILLDEHLIKPFVLNAQLIPDQDRPDQHQLLVDSFNFGFGKKNNVQGNFRITNPDSPQIVADLEAQMKFKKMQELLPSEYMKLKKGYFKLNLVYKSPLYDTINAVNYLLNAELDGKVELVNGKIYYNYRDFTFDNIYGNLRFDEKDFYIDDLALEVNDNKLLASGQSKDFFSFFILPDRRAQIDLKVASPKFDFGQFTAPEGIDQDSLEAVRNTIVEIEPDSTAGFMTSTGSFIDLLLAKGSIEMSTDVKILVYNKFKADNVLGSISLQPDTVQLKNMKFDVADGYFTMDGSISDIVRHKPKMELQVLVDENNLQEIFRQFDNFGQSDFGHQNLKGIASATVNFKTDVSSNYAILPETMHGDVQFKLSGGHLLDVAALTSKKGFLYKKRKLDRVVIDTVSSTLHIRGNSLYLDKFLVHSSSFDFELEGVYNLAQTDSTRLFISIPTGNLFVRHLSDDILLSGTARRKGPRILLEARQKEDGVSFRLPLRRKKRLKQYRLEE